MNRSLQRLTPTATVLACALFAIMRSLRPSTYKAPVRETMDYKRYRRTQIAEMEPWVEGYDMTGVSVSASDRAAGSPRAGDMIARNPRTMQIGEWRRCSLPTTSSRWKSDA